ncbi:hypothetical protein [Fischerella thermalis]|nr:hypothetical protein [Fischerella thermalis]
MTNLSTMGSREHRTARLFLLPALLLLLFVAIASWLLRKSRLMV